VENAASVGAVLKEKLTQLQQRHRVIGEVRGLGLMIGVDFELSNGSHEPDGKLRDRVMQKCFETGLLLLSCGESTLRFCPPLIVTEKEVATAVEIFDRAVGAAK
ncbi:MAG: aminotransferase class III-fold pyridoxal phosphate-dependent enzyme, partial [Candidatus Binatia bacterium]